MVKGLPSIASSSWQFGSTTKICDMVFLEQSMPIERRSGRHQQSANDAGKLRDLQPKSC